MGIPVLIQARLLQFDEPLKVVSSTLPVPLSNDKVTTAIRDGNHSLHRFVNATETFRKG